jgi:aspartate/methionine/tyrosine aminotransferase
LHTLVHERGGVTLIDEIYLALSHEAEFGQTALALPDELQHSLVSINSFSKYFNMTGWRLGWLVLPPALVPVVEKLAQHLYICPSTVAQHAALACFEPESLAEYEKRRAEFKARRDYFIPELQRLGFEVPVVPDGAFYAYADARKAIDKLGLHTGRADGTGGSWDLAFELMQRARVVLTPGRDFGQAQPQRYLRFSTASAMAQLQEAVSRLEAVLG